ncbi:MAG: hypothetical protein CMB80_01125 [Flammeovirgaceae bacterium]|nr:hypothetical protein [Flammeovirgaceae bacterium]|tara:strand:- start:83 stop:367 length:285 start_codon:yes stop_codon:yes gene_type:complete
MEKMNPFDDFFDHVKFDKQGFEKRFQETFGPIKQKRSISFWISIWIFGPIMIICYQIAALFGFILNAIIPLSIVAFLGFVTWAILMLMKHHGII